MADYRPHMLSLCSLLILAATNCRSVSTQPPPALAKVDDWLYQLQKVDLNALRATQYDLVVIDYSNDGSGSGEWQKSEIENLKKSAGGKIVLAYISIGEAESYRYYWQPGWHEKQPEWLGRGNPDWQGNYKAKYWDQRWQNIVLAYIDRIIDQGFDGIYLDIVDAYWYWAEEASGFGEAEQLGTTREAANRMIRFVLSIASHCRQTRGRPDFILCPQNGSDIIRAADPDLAGAYLDAVDAIGAEDTFFFGDREVDNTFQPQRDVIANLDEFVARAKPVLATEYLSPQNRTAVDRFYRLGAERGYIPFASGRALDELRVNPGHEPD